MNYGNIYGNYSKTQVKLDKYVEKNYKRRRFRKNKRKLFKLWKHLWEKYAVKTNYGNWDESFTMDELDTFIEKYYKKLKKGGTLIVFFYLWKIETLKDILEKHNFKQIRMN